MYRQSFSVLLLVALPGYLSAGIDLRPADDPRPPARLAEYRERPEHALVRARVRDVRSTFVRTEQMMGFGAESVAAELIVTEWVADGAVRVAPWQAGELSWLLVAKGEGDEGYPWLGPISPGREYWFVLWQGEVHPKPRIMTWAEVGGAGQPLPTPSERLSAYRDRSNHALVRVEVQQVQVGTWTEGATESRPSEKITVRIAEVVWNTMGWRKKLAGLEKGRLRHFISRPKPGEDDRPDLGIIRPQRSYWFVVKGGPIGFDPTIVAWDLLPCPLEDDASAEAFGGDGGLLKAEGDRRHPPQRFQWQRAYGDRALVLGTVREVESIVVSGDERDRVTLDISRVEWVNVGYDGLMNGLTRLDESGLVYRGLQTVPDWDGRCRPEPLPFRREIEVGGTYWMVLWTDRLFGYTFVPDWSAVE